jgi:molecular chaperone DnaK
MRRTAFGIDLGTTNSSIAFVDETERPTVVENALGEATTPSVVYFDEPGSVVVGRPAKAAAVLAPHLVAQLVKRGMGHADGNRTYHGQVYEPETISAFVLQDLARSAAARTGDEVLDVVITVPAYFGVAERDATLKAGRIAELNVLSVLDEPVAAALAYQARRPAEGVRHLLVYDLGGGTFDTTVIRVDGDEFRVVCTDGDLRLGGVDWDARIREFMLETFTARHPRLDPTADERLMNDVATGAEQLKMELSATRSGSRNIRFGGEVAEVVLTRDNLEELTADLLDRTLTITERTIEAARRKGVPVIDEAILVGGMTRMAAIPERLRERFGIEARRHDPDLAVVKGAALEASRLSAAGTRAAGDRGAPATGISSAPSQKVATVVPRGFGIKVIDEHDPIFATKPHLARQFITHLLPANTPLPADSGPVAFMTGASNQPFVEVEVWEQKGGAYSEEVADNAIVGRGRLRVPPKLPMRSLIHVTFTMAETGTLTVSAREPTSGNELNLELQIGGMDETAVDAARTAVAQHRMSS